jgi:hypothetical protein
MFPAVHVRDRRLLVVSCSSGLPCGDKGFDARIIGQLPKEVDALSERQNRQRRTSVSEAVYSFGADALEFRDKGMKIRRERVSGVNHVLW